MIVDSSALVAVLTGEPEADRFIRLIARTDAPILPAPTYLETSMVMAARKGDGLAKLDEFLSTGEFVILPFTQAHALAARDAFTRYGKGRHAAGLNFGDCIAYAVAMVEDRPLLFKDGDFHLTDVRPALVR